MIGLRGIPSKDGGVEVAMGELAPMLINKDIEVFVYCRSSYSDKNLKEYHSVKLIHFPTINSKHLEAIVHTFISTIHALFQGFHIIHFHADGNALFCWLPRLFGIKTVVTLHGQDWQRAKWGKFSKFILKLGEHIGVYLSSKTISVSSKIIDYYKGKKLVHIPNGIPKTSRVSNSQILEKFGIENYILYLGRLVPEKGIHLLIRAYNQLNIDDQLVIVGDATNTTKYLDELKLLSKNNHNIIFTGGLFGPDKQALIENARLFVMPSLLEGMPIVLLEMMNQGIPCLVSNIPEILEVVGKTEKYCTTFSNNNMLDLKSKILNTLNDVDLIQKKASYGKSLVQTKYDWKVIAKQTHQVYLS